MTLRDAPARGAVAVTTPLARLARSGEVVDLVRRGEAATISELSSAMRMARSTVTERVEALLTLGLLRTEAETANRRGRPATKLSFNSDAGVVLTAQLGMSGLRVGVSNLAGEILATHSADIPIARGPEEVLTLLEHEFDSALAEAGRSRDYVLGIGVGVPGRTELETAADLGGAGTHPWSHFPIEHRLRQSFGDVTVLTDRGVSLLAIAEQRAFYPDADVVLGVKAGTVIECGIVVGGAIVRGGAHLAGEMGHTPVTDRDVPCVCGNRGCLNAVAGGAALARDLATAGLPVQTTRDVARLALEGVGPAAQAVRESGRNIGQVLGGAINLLNPDVIVVWGYLADAGEQLFAGMRETLYRYGVPAATEHVQVEKARLGDDAGIRGAATSVIEEILTPEALDRFVRRTAAPV